MSAEINKAVVSRWNDTGLDTSLGVLRFGSNTLARSPREVISGQDQSSNVFGAGNQTTMPRYEFVTDFDEDENLWEVAQVLVTMVRFHAYRATVDDAANDVETIRGQFVDSERATTNPLSIPSSIGNIMGVQHFSRNTLKLDDAVFLGIEQIEIRWAECIPVQS